MDGVPEAQRARIEAGDGRALLSEVSRLGREGVPLPEWLAQEFGRRVDEVLFGRVGSWDDAFGSPFPKGYQVARRYQERKVIRPKVYAAIRRAVFSDPKQPIDKGFWERIGKEAAVGATRAEDVYGKGLRWHPSIQELRVNYALAVVASRMLTEAPGRAIDASFFAEWSKRTGVPLAYVEAWYVKQASDDFVLCGDPAMTAADEQNAAPVKLPKNAGVRRRS